MSLTVDITKNLKGFQLHTSLRTEDGCVGILGASGCGKSMTLKCIAGIVTPDQGKIILNGRTLFDSEAGINVPPQERNVGYLFQNYALFPHMTVKKNIEMGMSKLGKEEKEKRVTELLELYDLNGLEMRYPRQLSGGQQQRVALARIMGSDPEILLLDEPFSALDVYLKDQIQSQVRRVLRQYTKDTILVSHDIHEVRRFCSHVIVMSDGRCVETGAIGDIFRNPAMLQTARLAGVRNVTEIENRDGICWASRWGIPLSDQTCTTEYAGIRDRDLIPLREVVPNSIPVVLSDQIECDDEYQLQYAILDKTGCETGEYLWYRISGNAAAIIEEANGIKAFAIRNDELLWLNH